MSTKNIFPAGKTERERERERGGERDHCRETSKKKNGKSQARRLLCCWELQDISYSRHTARLSYQNNFHIHTEKYIYMCTGRPKKESSVTIYLFFIYDVPGLFLGTCTEQDMLRFFTALIKKHLQLFFT